MSEQNERIKDAAEKGWSEFVKTEEADPKDFPSSTKVESEGKAIKGAMPTTRVLPFDELDALHKAGLYAMVTAIVADPYAEPYASLMPANHQRKAYRGLDDCLRDALGYARYRHGE